MLHVTHYMCVAAVCEKNPLITRVVFSLCGVLDVWDHAPFERMVLMNSFAVHHLLFLQFLFSFLSKYLTFTLLLVMSMKL